MERAEAQAEENKGEISEILNSYLDKLEIERDIKIGNVCRYYKSLLAESEMVKSEAKKLIERSRVTENKAEYLKKYLAVFVDEGERFQDENSKVSWRKSEMVIIKDDIDVPKEYQRITIAPDKTGLKKAIKAGEEFEGISIIEKQNIQIK